MAFPIVTDEERQERRRQAARKFRAAGKQREYRRKTAAQHRARNLFCRQRFIDAGLCAYCGKCPPSPSRRSCQECREIVNKNNRAKIDRKVAQGLCPNCGTNPVLPAMRGKRWSFCERCYFKKTSTDCLKTAKHADLIGQKLKDQNYRCAYTSEEIILGLNDSLDHILPISKFPELRNDPTNVEWVTRKVNCMKWDSTREEFIATAYAIVRHYESQRQLAA